MAIRNALRSTALAPILVAARRMWPGVAIFLATIGLTLLFWALLPASLSGDDGSDYSAFYAPVARNLVAGHGLQLPDGSAATRYPPGYPLLLAGGFALAAVLHLPEAAVQAALVLLCLGAAATLLWSVARSVWGSRLAAGVALIWATYPFMLWLTKQPSSEVPFVAFFYAGLALAWHALRAGRRTALALGAAGALLGVAMLIRPLAVGVGLLVAGLILVGWRPTPPRIRLGMALAVLLGNLLVVGPWEVWLIGQTGGLPLLSTGGVASMRDGLTFAVNAKGYRQAVAVPPDVLALMATVRSRSDDLNSVGRLAGFLAQTATAQPATVARLFAIKAARSWYATDSARSERLILGVQLLYLVPIVGAGLAIRRRGPPQARRLLNAVILLAGYFWLMTILALSVLRYMVPAMGLLLLLLPAVLPLRLLPARAPASDGRP